MTCKAGCSASLALCARTFVPTAPSCHHVTDLARGRRTASEPRPRGEATQRCSGCRRPPRPQLTTSTEEDASGRQAPHRRVTPPLPAFASSQSQPQTLRSRDKPASLWPVVTPHPQTPPGSGLVRYPVAEGGAAGTPSCQPHAPHRPASGLVAPPGPLPRARPSRSPAPDSKLVFLLPVIGLLGLPP